MLEYENTAVKNLGINTRITNRIFRIMLTFAGIIEASV